jgi:hypothetical protein
MAPGVQDPARTPPERGSGQGAGPERGSGQGAGPEPGSGQGAGPERGSRQGPGPERGSGQRPGADRYEPLPGVAGLPRWLWSRLPRPARVGLALLPVAVLAFALLVGPGIDESKEERAQAERERLERLAAERAERLRAEQRPRFRAGRPAGADLEARAALFAALGPAVEADARGRVAAGQLDGPVRAVECEPYPRSAAGGGAHLDPSEPSGRYACLAVTREIEATEFNEASAIGHPYRAMIDFGSGRYAFCKVSGRPGEGSIGRQQPVPVPAACGGN